MDSPRNTWVDTWESRNGSISNHTGGNVRLFPEPLPTKPPRSADYFTLRNDVREATMDTKTIFTADTANDKDSVTEIGNDTVISVKVQASRDSMFMAPPASLQRPINDINTASVLSNGTSGMQMVPPQSRNQLSESRWATSKKPKGHTSSAKCSAITTHVSTLDTSGEQLPRVQSQEYSSIEQYCLRDSTRVNEHKQKLLPYLRRGLVDSVCGPPTKIISTEKQWSENNIPDKSLNGRSSNCESEEEYHPKGTKNTSNAGYSGVEPTTKPIRRSVAAHTTSHPPTRKHMLTQKEPLRNASPVPDSTPDQTSNIECQSTYILPQLKSDVSKLPAHLKRFYVKYAAGRHIHGEPRAVVANLNLQLGTGQISISQEQPTEQTSILVEKPVGLTRETFQIVSNTEKDSVFATKASTAGYITRTAPVPSVENSLEFNSADDGSKAAIKDIRGQEPQETWDKQDWDAPRRARPKRNEWESETNMSDGSVSSDNSAFVQPDCFLHRYVRFWLNAIPQFEDNLFRSSPSEVHEEHDINPIDGRLMAPIEAPIVVRNEFGLDHPALQQKFEMQTAEWSTNRWLEMIERRQKREEEQEKQRAYERQQQEMAEVKASKGNPYLCRVPAHLRPATEGDMEEVTRIYNQEVREGWRVLDQEPQTVAAFTDFLRFCRLDNIPFIVAMSEYRDPNVRVEEANHRVIGFAFLDIASRGVFGSTRSNGKHSARLYVMVDPPYRCNRLGTALIDRMLVITSRGYMEKEFSYQFENPKNDPVYKPELHNPRQWRIIQMEVYIENLGNLAMTKAGEEYKVVWAFLEDFAMARHTSNYGIAGRHGQKYLDRLLFEHRCRDSDGNWYPED